MSDAADLKLAMEMERWLCTGAPFPLEFVLRVPKGEVVYRIASVDKRLSWVEAGTLEAPLAMSIVAYGSEGCQGPGPFLFQWPPDENKSDQAACLGLQLATVRGLRPLN